MAISPDVVERARARVGMVLGNKYRLDRLLGIGGMAAVYAATHRNKKRVAVKMLHPELGIDATVKSRFLREGYAANTVDHPGAVAVFDDDVTADGSAFLVMELLVGETLDARADRKGGTLPLAEVLPLADQVLDVLAAAHEKGLLHRDIKPDNLFLTSSGQLKVLDFGIARLRELTDDKATGVGSFMGTPAFMSPEQARGRWDDVDLRSDVWAVGATIFNLLSGRSVHETESVGEQLVMAATIPAPPLISVMPHVQPLVAEIVDRALAFDKAARWPNVGAMQTALKQAIAVIAPSGELTIPMASLPIVDVDRDAATLAIGDAFHLNSDSRPSAPIRDSRGGSIPSPVTSRTGSEPVETQRRSRGLIFVGTAAAAALATVFLWPRAPSSDESDPVAGVTPGVPVAPEPPALKAKLDPLPVPAPVPVAEADAGPPLTKPSAVAKTKPPHRSVGPARPPVSAAAADPVKSTSPPSAATPAKTADPLSKRY